MQWWLIVHGEYYRGRTWWEQLQVNYGLVVGHMRGKSGGYVPPTNTNKGRHHKLDVGQILWQVGVF